MSHPQIIEAADQLEVNIRALEALIARINGEGQTPEPDPSTAVTAGYPPLSEFLLSFHKRLERDSQILFERIDQLDRLLFQEDPENKKVCVVDGPVARSQAGENYVR